ncbi:hypothetical protein EJB05_13014, partial [Eragrostis curvula]
MLKDERLVQHAPTQHPTSEELRIARRVWKDYYAAKVDAVVYMVDAADGRRFGESKAELDALLSDDALAGVPFLVLGNKIDVPHAAPESDLRAAISGWPAAPPARVMTSTSPAPACGP